MELSIVDTSQVAAGGTTIEALEATAQLAQLADRIGYAATGSPSTTARAT